MENRISKISSIWAEKVELRNPYIFGDEEISLSEFSELFKDTFEIIKTAKNDFIYKGIFPSDTITVLDYIELIANLSKYMTYDCMDDESERKTFTATCLVAQKLVDYASCSPGFRTTDSNSFEYFDTDDFQQGILTFNRDDYPYYSDEPSNDSYKYCIYEGDFEEILDLALQL